MTRRTPAEYDWKRALFNGRRLSKHFTSPRRGRIKTVTLHHSTIVGNGNAAALETMYGVWQKRQASANYGIDGVHVWQYVSDNDAAWANATSSNHETLSIEHTNSTAGPSWKVSDETIATGARLVATLHLLYGLGRPSRKTVRMHRDYYATACPGPYMVAHLADYIDKAGRAYDQMKAGKPATAAPSKSPSAPTPPTARVAVWDLPSTWEVGSTGAAVTRLGERIRVWSKALGLPDPYKVGPGAPLGPADVAGLSKIQRKWWPSGSTTKGGDADGYPGAETFNRLAADPTPLGVLVTSLSHNLAGNNRHGIVTASKRIPRAVTAARALTPHVLNVQETTVASRVRSLLDSGLKGAMTRRGGGKGRYVYLANTAHHVAGGLITAKSSTWHKRDDKQAGYEVYEVDGARGLDVSLHLESESGPAADRKRVDQMGNILDQAVKIAALHKVPLSNVLLVGDTNSEGMVADALAARGWRNVATSGRHENTPTFTGWDGRSARRFDYGFVHQSCLHAVLVAVDPNTTLSDHARLTIRRTLTK